MSLNYALLVLSPPDSLINRRALEFCRELLNQSHRIERVFFHDAGAASGLGSTVYPQDERNPTDEWTAFANENQVELIVCIASALKRGVIDAAEAKRYQQQSATMHPAFEIGGLGLLVDAGANCDRLITFGG